MKKFITALTALLTITASASAMSYSQARDRALFLTDKMAYELNLTEEQYEAAYEVNLDYLMSINTYDDLYGAYWTNRNLDLSYILLDWQYRAFCAASYFYRPLIWDAGVWHFSIYARYPHRSYFYFGRPAFYATYRGGHGWHVNGGHSWYRGRDFGHGSIASGHGMKDRFDRGDFRGQSFGANSRSSFSRQNANNRGWNNGSSIRRNGSYNAQSRTQRARENNGYTTRNGSQNRQRANFGGSRTESRVNRESSTRATVRPQQSARTSRSQFNGTRSSQRSLPSRPSNTFTPRSSSSSSQSVRTTPSRSTSGNSGTTHGGGSVSRSSGGSHSGGGHFGGRR